MLHKLFNKQTVSSNSKFSSTHNVNTSPSADTTAHIQEMAELAAMYEQQQSWKEAFYWGKKAAEQGCADAQLAIGTYYILGLGTPQNLQQAELWLLLAAQQGSLAAHFNLGQFYSTEAHTAFYNMEKARHHLHIAAEGGHAMAQKRLIELFDN